MPVTGTTAIQGERAAFVAEIHARARSWVTGMRTSSGWRPIWWIPAAVAWIPFVGAPITDGDQIYWMWQRPAESGGNLWQSIVVTVTETSEFWQAGNFRPLGRILFDWFESMRWPVADLIGVPPTLCKASNGS